MSTDEQGDGGASCRRGAPDPGFSRQPASSGGKETMPRKRTGKVALAARLPKEFREKRADVHRALADCRGDG
jgi:hypothetical protein